MLQHFFFCSLNSCWTCTPHARQMKADTLANCVRLHSSNEMSQVSWLTIAVMFNLSMRLWKDANLTCNSFTCSPVISLLLLLLSWPQPHGSCWQVGLSLILLSFVPFSFLASIFGYHFFWKDHTPLSFISPDTVRPVIIYTLDKEQQKIPCVK